MSKILITGCPRSGTRYLSNVFNRVGLDVGHECVRFNGCSSGFYVGDFPTYPVGHKEPVSSINWFYVIHIIRDPQKAVPSLARLLTDVAAVRRWYKQFGLITDSVDQSAMNVWYWSHKNVIKNIKPDITVNIDWFPEYWPEISHKLNITHDFPYKVRIDNSYPYTSKYTWEDLNRIDLEKSVQVKDFWFKLLQR